MQPSDHQRHPPHSPLMSPSHTPPADAPADAAPPQSPSAGSPWSSDYVPSAQPPAGAAPAYPAYPAYPASSATAAKTAWIITGVLAACFVVALVLALAVQQSSSDVLFCTFHRSSACDAVNTANTIHTVAGQFAAGFGIGTFLMGVAALGASSC